MLSDTGEIKIIHEDLNTGEAFGKLRSDVEYIKRDIADIKADVKELRVEMTGKFEAVSGKFELVRSEARSDFRWLLGLIITLTGITLSGFLGILGVIAHGFKWI